MRKAENKGWNSQSDPDSDTLDEVKELIEKGYSAEVIWLIRSVYDNEEESDYFEECETIIIRDYLGRHDLVKMI